MFFKIGKKINEKLNGPVAVLDSLAARNINMFLARDDGYRTDCEQTLKEYYDFYLSYLQKAVSMNGEAKNIQKFIDRLSPLNDQILQFGGDEWKSQLDTFSDEAIALIAFSDSFRYSPIVVDIHFYHEFSAQEYLNYIYEKRREGAYYVAGLILRFHYNFGGEVNDEQAYQYLSFGISRASTRKALSINKEEVELPMPANLRSVKICIKGYDEGRKKYDEAVASETFPPGVIKYEMSIDLDERKRKEEKQKEIEKKRESDVLLNSDEFKDEVIRYSRKINIMLAKLNEHAPNDLDRHELNGSVAEAIQKHVEKRGSLEGLKLTLSRSLIGENDSPFPELNSRVGRFCFELEEQYLLREREEQQESMQQYFSAANVLPHRYTIVRAIGHIALCCLFLRLSYGLNDDDIDYFQNCVLALSLTMTDDEREFAKREIIEIRNTVADHEFDDVIVTYVDSQLDNGKNPERKALVNMFITSGINSMFQVLNDVAFRAR